MLDRQLLQTHFIYKFFLSPERKNERVFFLNFFSLQKLQNFAGKPILHWENHDFLSFSIKKITINKLYLLGKINGDIRSFPSSHSFFWFCMYAKWQLCKGRFSQIWLQAKYESRVFEHPSIFLAIYLNHV
jgi:hypothetical protein